MSEPLHVPPVIDVEIRYAGSVTQLFINTSDAQEWVEDNLDTEGWQWMGNALCVESRFVDAVVQGMRDDGLEVR